MDSIWRIGVFGELPENCEFFVGLVTHFDLLGGGDSEGLGESEIKHVDGDSNEFVAGKVRVDEFSVEG